ncbi:putative clathrin assembly protein At4g25940 isoform X2 [Wolffia australiana]
MIPAQMPGNTLLGFVLMHCTWKNGLNAFGSSHMMLRQKNAMGELKTGDLLEHLAAFQQLLFRLLECQPDGAAKFNSVIQYAFSIVGSECVKLYAAIDSATILMVNRFFDMQPHDAVRALEIYRKAGQQAGRLSDFYEFCNGLNLWKSEKIIRVKQPPESFVAAMEEYVKEAPRSMPSPFNEGGDREESFPRHELKKVNDNKARPVSVPDLETVDLLGLDDIDWGAAEFDGRNFSSLYFSAAGNPPNRSTVIQEPATGDEDWKLELVPMERKMSPDSGDSSETTEMTTSPCESSVFKEMESSHAVEGSLTAVDELAGDKLTVAAAATAAVVDLSNPFGDPIGSITQRNGSF